MVKPKTRSLATHANPITGERDVPILTTLTQKMDQENPTFAVAMLPSGVGGQIRVGDQAALLIKEVCAGSIGSFCLTIRFTTDR